MNIATARGFVGKDVWVSRGGDLWMDSGLRPVLTYFIADPNIVKLVKITKGGMALVEKDGKTYAVPPRNVMPLEAE